MTTNEQLVSILNRLIAKSITSSVQSTIRIVQDEEQELSTSIDFFDKNGFHYEVDFYDFSSVEINEQKLKKCIDVLDGDKIQDIKVVEELFMIRN